MHLPQRRPHLGRPPVLQQNVVVNEGPGEPLRIHVAFLLEGGEKTLPFRARSPVVQLSAHLSRGTLGAGAPMSYLSGDSLLH